MNNSSPELPKPNMISGSEYQIMTLIADYASNHEPINEYFDPIEYKRAYQRDSHKLSFEEKQVYHKIFREYVVKQREAFSEIFRIIEELLTENPDLNISVLDSAYVEMAKLYGFNYKLNQTYINFRDYYVKCRDFMKRLEIEFPNKVQLLKNLTGLKDVKPSDFDIKRGPFAFEIRATQELINRKGNISQNQNVFERIAEKIVPSTALNGFSSKAIDYGSGISAQYIFYPKDDIVLDIFRNLDYLILEKVNNRKLRKDKLPPQKFKLSKQTIRDHENKHALYNLVMTSENLASNRNIVQEIRDILKNPDANAVKEEDFSNFCLFLIENVFYENAGDELIARIADGNFVSSIPDITNEKIYNYTKAMLRSLSHVDSLFIYDTVEELTKSGKNAQKYRTIYDSYTEQANQYIKKVSLRIARFLILYPDYHRQLANKLMFAKFPDWIETINEYSEYLQNKK